MDDLERRQIATGIVGFAVSMALMEKLRERDLLNGFDCADIIERALSSVEGLDAVQPTEVYRLARELLEAQHKSWSAPPDP